MTPPHFPFPDMPYGAPPAWCFPLVETGVYVCTVLCFLHARKRGAAALSYLLGGIAFGLLLEYFEVATDSYVYGRFLIMLGRAPVDIPLWVGCAWGVIMYTARLFSDSARLPLFAAAALDTLLALNIDVSIDAIAYRMHMWHWDWTGTGKNPLTAQWFGIPYANFVGWITVVFCYSAFSRLFERWLGRGQTTSLRAAVIPLLAILCSLGALMTSELVLYPPMTKYLGLGAGPRLVLETVALLILVIRGWGKRPRSPWSLDAIAQGTPFWFHASFIFFLFALGFYRENPWMATASCVNFLIGVLAHTAPHWSARRSAAENDASSQAATA